jgi:hypothetical protein
MVYVLIQRITGTLVNGFYFSTSEEAEKYLLEFHSRGSKTETLKWYEIRPLINKQ